MTVKFITILNIVCGRDMHAFFNIEYECAFVADSALQGGTTRGKHWFDSSASD